MTHVQLRRVLPSEELPHPPAEAPGRLRDRATAGTIIHPEFREVDVAGRPVLLTRLLSGEVVAFAAHCPHQGVPLRQGNIDRGNIRCEQHKYVYDPRTGRNILPSSGASPGALERLRPGHLTTYAVEERDGWVYVATRPNPPPDEQAPLPPFAPSARPAAQPPAASEAPLDLPPSEVEVAAGSEFELDLPTRPRPSHVWRVEVDGDAVAVLGQRLDRQPEVLHYRLRAVAQHCGLALVRCTYGKPWGAGDGETRTFSVTVRDP